LSIEAVRAVGQLFLFMVNQKFSQIILLLIFLTLGFESCFSEEKKNHQNEKANQIKLSFTGDLMNHKNIFEFARISKDSFDFNPYFEFVKDEISSADFAIGNLETVIYGENKIPTGYPTFNAPVQFLEALSNNGFDILTTANNHITDYRKEGIIKTLENINKRKLNYVGTSISKEESNQIKIFSKNGISFALLNYTYDLNIKNLSKSENFYVNLIDSAKIKKDLERAKNESPDFIVVIYHFGEEYKTIMNKNQKQLVDFSFRNGADIIIGHHPHVMQPFEVQVDNQNSKISKFAAYSLGNFISNQRQRYTDGSGILNIYLSKKNQISQIDSVDFVPTWAFRGKINGKETFRILPAQTSENLSRYDFLNEFDRKKMLNSINDNWNIINKFSRVREKLLRLK